MAVEQGVPPEWERWRGGVDAKLDEVDRSIKAVDTKVEKQSELLRQMPDEIEDRVRRAINNGAKNRNPQKNETVTFRWLAEKAFLPILLGLAMAAIGYMIAAGG